MKKVEKILNVLNFYSKLGESKSLNGARLIGKAPHIASEAWLQTLFPGLNEVDLNFIENELRIVLPDEYKSFLSFTNGLHLFNVTLALHGYPKSHSREIDEREPFNIFTRNIFERIDDSLNSYLYIGSYFNDGSLVYIDTETGFVHRCTRETSKSLCKWESFLIFLESEITRLMKLFDDKGFLISKDRTVTLPC